MLFLELAVTNQVWDHSLPGRGGGKPSLEAGKNVVYPSRRDGVCASMGISASKSVCVCTHGNECVQVCVCVFVHNKCKRMYEQPFESLKHPSNDFYVFTKSVRSGEKWGTLRPSLVAGFAVTATVGQAETVMVKQSSHPVVSGEPSSLSDTRF